MANFEIDEDQAALIRELRKLETSDPVHANVYNALFEKLINNDAFLERLANKMVEKSMLCHVLDSVNAQQVLAADVGPKITAITNELKENVSVLNTKIDAFEAPWDELYNGLPASLPIIDLSGYKSFRLQLYAVDGTATGGWYDFDVDINSSRIEISYFQTTSIYKRVLMGFNSKHLGFISQAQGTWTTSSLYLIVQAK